MNLASISGNFGFDPELKTSQKGDPVFNGSLVVNSRSKKKKIYVDIVAFGKVADHLGNYCKKGTWILVEDGEIIMDEWVDKNTQKKMRKLKLVVNRIDLGPKDKDEDDNKNNNDTMPQFDKDDDGF